MVTHTPGCPGGDCSDPDTTFVCDTCWKECAACYGVSESETCDECTHVKETLGKIRFT